MQLISKDRTFYKKVLLLALPIAMQSLITIGVNMLDTIMIGRLGEMKLSATSLTNLSRFTIFSVWGLEWGHLF